MAAAAAGGAAGWTFAEDLSAAEVAELGSLLAGLGPGACVCQGFCSTAPHALVSVARHQHCW